MFDQLFSKLGFQQQSADNPETIESRRQQIQALGLYLGNVHLGSGSRKRIIESVRLVSEAAVWSDRRNPPLLFTLIDAGVPQSLLRLLQDQQRSDVKRETATAVTVQILQTLSIILDGVSDTGFLQAFLGNGFVNDLIGAPVDLECEEVVVYYVAFLKALSLKLTQSTIRLFFSPEDSGGFPLFTAAISLFDHSDSMVRVAVRAITLNVIRISNGDVVEYLLESPKATYFWGSIVMHAVKACVDDAVRLLVDNGSWAGVDSVLENHMGLLAYVNDVCALGVDRINRRMVDEFRDRILARTYVHSIDIGWRANASPEETLYMQVATLCLAHFFAIVRYSPLLVDTLAALFTVRDEEKEASGSLISDQANHNPFIPSPFEPSRTLVPWLSAVLEVLGNKAISPTALVKSVLVPRRMLRTRALLESLTGDWRSDSAQSTASSLADHVTLPPLTQTIVTAMVHVLTDHPPAHSWPAVSLAGHVVAQLTSSARGHVVLDPGGLADELIQAQSRHSAELRAMLMDVDELEDDTDSEHTGSSGTTTGGSAICWKTLVKCLFDFANSNSDTLRSKIQSESRHVFATQPVTTPASPFEVQGGSTHEQVFLARLYQAHCLKRLVAAHPDSPILAKDPYTSDLYRWLGAHITPDMQILDDAWCSATVIDNTAKHALPKRATRLGFSAMLSCIDGILVIRQLANESPVELIWPMADLVITRVHDEMTDAGHLPTLRISDTPFPPLFFPPPSADGIPTPTNVLRGKRLRYSYLGEYCALDFSVRFRDPMECDNAWGLLSRNVAVSRRALADIYLNYNVI
ncbi:Protein CL16A [Coemansia sp. BCRC 34301]|nr:Protein CL16A [Coemansia sp. BCRC 34301]